MTEQAAGTVESGGDAALAPGGNYEVIRARLVEQSKVLGAEIDALNERRKEVFGGTELAVIANERIRLVRNLEHPTDCAH